MVQDWGILVCSGCMGGGGVACGGWDSPTA